jgi:ribosome-associated protein
VSWWFLYFSPCICANPKNPPHLRPISPANFPLNPARLQLSLSSGVTFTLMVPDFFQEIQFQFSRSGGKGGQNVNKVESAATGFWSIPQSQAITENQRRLLMEKLAHRLTNEGVLIIKSQTHRSQLSNREEVIEKFKETVAKALQHKKLRIATHPSKASAQRRIEAKKSRTAIKNGRQRVRLTNL